ncbi:MAG: serine/threonine-protein phosphatase [Eubacterium sp.]|nr:serine/threonine-protein phosphatase [Eubacterium sp.]
MAVYYLSDINKRSANEDSFLDIEYRVNHEATVHAMTVADGMGGLSGGKQYANNAVRLFHEGLLRLIMGEEFKDSPLERQMELLQDFCGQIFQQINQELYMNGLNAGMKGGTTLTAAIHFWDSWIIGNCGDSPAYVLKDGQISLVSEIQNAAWELVRHGKTREGSLVFHQNKARLLQYLGRRLRVLPHITRLSDEEVDLLLIGSDGAFGDLDRDQITEILSGEKEKQDILGRLFERAREGGEEDNQTAVMFCTDRPDYYQGPEAGEFEENDIEEALPGIYVELDDHRLPLKERLRSYLHKGGKSG